MESFHLHRGLTLVELMVVLAIIGIIMSIVLNSQSTFNKTIILKNAAYDIALTLRSVETYGLGSRATVGNVKNAGYGVHFQSGAQGSFILFADTSPSASCTMPDCKPGDHIYTSGDDTFVQTYTLGNGITISDFCAFSGRWWCASASELSSLDIVFARPNPDAFIRSGGSSYTSACLAVTSPQGGAKYVSVASSGQITANAAPCP
jgi:prepilin-type N-terminal cleavage/methylation domain-containing protein